MGGRERGADAGVVGLGPAFLQADYLRYRDESCEVVAYLDKPCGAVGGDVFEAPAV